METKNKKTVREITLGKVKIAIWRQDFENNSKLQITASKLYKPKDSKSLKFSSSFDRDDLPLLIKAIDQAHSCIFELEHEARKAA